MSKKLAILAAAYQLESFTVSSLAARSRSSSSTVQTVLNRAPQDWFKVSKPKTGHRGGQPKHYDLSPQGRENVKNLVDEFAGLTRLAPEQPPSVEPLGLISARNTAQKMATASGQALEAYMLDAVENLRWAEAELEDGGFSDDAGAILEEIQSVRDALNRNGVCATGEAVHAPIQKMLRRSDAQELFFKRQVRGLYKKVSRRPIFHASRARDDELRVVVAYRGVDVSVRELATYAQGALAFARGGSGVRMQEIVEGEFAGGSVGRGQFDSREGGLRGVVFCVNSELYPQTAREVVKMLKVELSAAGSVVVLDQGFSAEVKSLARKYHVRYEPHATESSPRSWVEDAISGHQWVNPEKLQG